MNKKIFVLCIIFCLLQVTLHAQPFSLNKNIVPKQLPLVEFKPKDNKKLEGKINFSNVQQTTDTAYFFVKGISIYSAVHFTFKSTDAADNTKVYLCKNNWNKPDKTAVLKNGSWDVLFRTEGSFGIMVVQGKNRKPYFLNTWVSAETTSRDIPSPFKTKNK
jgi:hypothetical protein